MIQNNVKETIEEYCTQKIFQPRKTIALSTARPIYRTKEVIISVEKTGRFDIIVEYAKLQSYQATIYDLLYQNYLIERGSPVSILIQTAYRLTTAISCAPNDFSFLTHIDWENIEFIHRTATRYIKLFTEATGQKVDKLDFDKVKTSDLFVVDYDINESETIRVPDILKIDTIKFKHAYLILRILIDIINCERIDKKWYQTLEELQRHRWIRQSIGEYYVVYKQYFWFSLIKVRQDLGKLIGRLYKPMR